MRADVVVVGLGADVGEHRRDALQGAGHGADGEALVLGSELVPALHLNLLQEVAGHVQHRLMIKKR